MPGDPQNLVLDLLRAIGGDIGDMRAEQKEHRNRLAAMDRTFTHAQRSLAHVETELAELRAEFGGRFDRVLDRLDRIERRLELRDA